MDIVGIAIVGRGDGDHRRQGEEQAKREAERPLGFIKKWIRDTFGGWTFNAGKRRQVFVDCLTPRGYEIGKR